MSVDRSFGWLGRFPLAVDLADTVRVVGSDDVELLVDEETLSTWVRAERPRYPVADAALGRLSEVRRLRDSVRSVLQAAVTGDRLPRHDVDVLNEVSARSATFPKATGDGAIETVEVNNNRFDNFCATVARSTFAILDDDASSLDICDAPSCGMLFVPANRRQNWCSPACGNRARVARHAARAKRDSH